MKKLSTILLILFVLVTAVLTDVKVKAKTLGDLKAELEKTKQDYINTKQEQKNTENKMVNVNSNIKQAQNDMEKAGNDIEALNKDIDRLNIEIEEKEKEIKTIVNFYQVSSGDSAYLEYVFGASDFTDMIYRGAVVEEMSKYNDTMIKQFNDKINENKKKQEELKQKQEELKEKQKNLEKEYSELGSKLKDIVDVKVDEEEAIRVQEEIIKIYKDKGCKDNEDIKTCGKKILPYDTKLWRPLNSGYISSNFGWRSYNGGEYHSGMDIGTPMGTPVYATANGTVVALTYKYRCGGNMIYIQHNINNKTYTSLYMHLSSINVSKGETVTKNTVIGYSGGAGFTLYKNGGWDKCSSGAHLHFTLLSGLVGDDYPAWSAKFYASLLNPRNYVNFPKLGKRFDDRLTAY